MAGAVYPNSIRLEFESSDPAAAGTWQGWGLWTYSGGTWINQADDLLGNIPLTVQYGIRSNSPTSLVATTGVMRFALNNSAMNDAGKVGFYSPDHADAWSGLELGRKVRLVVVYGNIPYVRFTGKIENIQPYPGAYGARYTLVTVTDWMNEAAMFKPLGLDVQTNKRADQLLTTLLAAMPVQPEDTDFDTGLDTFTYAFDKEKDEQTTALTLMQKIAQSELGHIYVKSDGTLVFMNRHTRLTPPLYFGLYEIDDTGNNAYYDTLETKRDINSIYNQVNVSAYPRKVDDTSGSPVVLYTLNNNLALNPGQTKTFTAKYTDPLNEAQRVSGQSMITPVITTDYKFSKTTDTDGDLSDDLDVTVVFGGNTAEVTLENTGAKGGVVTLFQLRGYGIYSYDPLEYQANDSTSQTAYGYRALNLSMPYQDNINTASAVADYIVRLNKDPQTIVNSISYVINQSLTGGIYHKVLDIGDVITIYDSVLGISTAHYWINGVSYNMTNGISGPIIYCSYYLDRYDTTDYFRLDNSQLDGTHILGP